jgi:hypothetical protein
MPSPSLPQPAHEPLTPTQLAAHFDAVQALVKCAVEGGRPVEVQLASPVPDSSVNDGWQLRLSCSAELLGRRVEFIAAHAVDLLIDVEEDDLGGDSIWDEGREVITSAADLPVVTAAIASWLLSEEWLADGPGFTACNSLDCTYSFIGDGVFATQRVRGTAPPATAPHWQRARERRIEHLRSRLRLRRRRGTHSKRGTCRSPARARIRLARSSPAVCAGWRKPA